MKLFVRTTDEERAWEKKHILGQREKYLNTNVIQKIAEDDGYRAKVELLEAVLADEADWILDIGSNTAGECEYLVHRGHYVIATDINEFALSISKERCRRFGRKSPAYIGCDGQKLPFADESVKCVVFNESLHHMPDPACSLSEVYRVLRPGGKVIMFEPYAYDPWRRISEIRDYFRGTVETSFSERRIRQLVADAGLEFKHIDRPVLPPSRWKLQFLPIYRRFLRLAYYEIKKIAPNILGMILCEARKPGKCDPDVFRPPVSDILVCPQTGAKLIQTAQGYVSTDPQTRYLYPVIDEIPVLIANEARQLDLSVWHTVIGS